MKKDSSLTKREIKKAARLFILSNSIHAMGDEAYRRLEDAVRGKYNRPLSHLESVAAIRNSRNPFKTFEHYEFGLDRMVIAPKESIIHGSFKDDSLYAIAQSRASFGTSKFKASFAWEQSIKGFCMGQSALLLDKYSLEHKKVFMISENTKTPMLWQILNPLKSDSCIVSKIVMEAEGYKLILGRETIKSVTDKLGVSPSIHAWGFNPESVTGITFKDHGSIKYISTVHGEKFELDVKESDIVAFVREVKVPINERSSHIVEEAMDIGFFEFVKSQETQLEWKKSFHSGTKMEYIPIEARNE